LVMIRPALGVSLHAKPIICQQADTAIRRGDSDTLYGC
jgi:hypothetical protein